MLTLLKLLQAQKTFPSFGRKYLGFTFSLEAYQKVLTLSAKVADHHTPDFYVDDSGMLLGMKTMTALTLDYLHKSR